MPPNPVTKYTLENKPSFQHSRLSDMVRDVLNASRMPKVPGIGIEVEFFLRDASTKVLCGIEQSQAFLTELSNLPDWSTFSKNAKTGKILKLSRELTGGRYHSVKYEHPPHMMEVAIAYETELISLRTSLLELRDALALAAQRAGVDIEIASRIDPPKLRWDDVRQIGSQFEELSLSRRKIFEGQNSVAPDSRIDFPAFTAATQVHIGGVHWWRENPDFLDRVYRTEFLISALAYRGNASLFRDRWGSYKYVFGEMPLLGFPSMDQWDFNSWIVGLLNTPYFSHGTSHFRDAIEKLDQERLRRELQGLRDLQIVKPKWIGTLEYRSDPAIQDVDLIIQLAAMRLGSHILARMPHFPKTLSHLSFRELSAEWWNGNHVNNYKAELGNLQQACYDALRTRGFGEEGLL